MADRPPHTNPGDTPPPSDPPINPAVDKDTADPQRPASPDASPPVLLALNGIGLTYNQGETSVSVLNDATLLVAQGEIVALVGPSGCGKTSLLQIAGLLSAPTEGTVHFDDQDCSSLSDRQRTAVRRVGIGFVYQFHHLMPEFTAIENVAFPLLIQGLRRERAFLRAAELLESVALTHRARHRPNALSGGEAQRVAIARAMAGDPKLVIADEPTGNLDPSRADDVSRMLCAFARERGAATLLATHNPNLAAMADRQVTIAEGRIVPHPTIAT